MKLIALRNLVLVGTLLLISYMILVSEILIEGTFDTLVTGGAGFVGHHVLMKMPNAVGIDSFNNYYDVSLKYKRAKISERVIEGNVCDIRLMRRLIHKYNIKKVIHLAAQAGVRFSFVFSKMGNQFKVPFDGTFGLLFGGEVRLRTGLKGI